MSWVGNKKFGSGNGKVLTANTASKQYDPIACFESFKKHWQQICEVILVTKQSRCGVKHDEILAVVSNLDYMITLLLLDLQSPIPTYMCLKHIMSENILDSFFSWSLQTGVYENALIVEQLKLYEVLISHSGEKLLSQDSFIQTLLKLLRSCLDICFSVDVEKRLVVLLHQLCVSFVHQNELLNNFFEKKTSVASPKFIIFSLLIPYVHREGTLGQQARDSLLLCMAFSKHNDALTEYIAIHSNICPVLATGLSGLYSLLPRKLNVEVDDWYCLTPDDVNEIPELATFMNSLEFCNAAVQVAHPVLVKNILAYLYQGFLLPVMGPALLQSADQELTAATAYFDLFIRSLTEPALIYSFIKFIISECYDGQRLLDVFIERLNGTSKLCMVNLSLMQTLVELNCEDVMLELILKYLIPCNHIMESQKCQIGQKDRYCENTEKFLKLTPNIYRSCRIEGSLYGDYHAYLADARSKIQACAAATSTWIYSYDGENPSLTDIAINYTCDDNDLEQCSFPLCDDQSSGYESFAKFNEVVSEYGSGGEFDSPNGSEISTEKSHVPVHSISATPCIGPFLQVLFNKLENMLTQSVFMNLQLTGLVSRLAIYSQPLLRSFLLDHSFIFQPSVRSLYQVIGCLKQRIEAAICGYSYSQVKNIVEDCESMLLYRENKLVNVRKYALQSPYSSLNCSQSPSNYHILDNDGKRNSFSSAFSQVFRRKTFYQTNSERQAEENKPIGRSAISYSEMHSIVMTGLLLSEWLKELAAISQEHSLY